MVLKDVFVDTSAWFAIQATSDGNHERAKKALPFALGNFRMLVTSNWVVGETYTLLRTAIGYYEARRFLDSINASPRLKTVFASPEQERRAYLLLHKYRDHAFSFVDALSFCIMKSEDIQTAFSYDSHFTVAGFSLVAV